MKTNNLTQGTFKSAARLGLLALLAAVAPAVSRASVVYTNFGTSPLFNTTQGNEIGPDGLGDDLAEADQFTAAATLNLSTIEIALSCVNTGLCPNSFAVALESDDAGSPANTVTPLASFTVTGSTLPILGSSIDQTLTYSGPTLTLDSGTSYWLVVLPDAAPVGTDQIAWNLNSIGQTSSTNNTATAFAGGGSSDIFYAFGDTPSAFEVDGASATSTPEPGTFGMMLGGGVLLGLVRKIRRA